MALPKHLQSTFLPSELSFMAESELVEIIPRQTLDAISLISCTIPKLKPPHRARVPLWLAILLKRQKRAYLIPPPWLSVESLTASLDAERKVDDNGDPVGFSRVPFKWQELADLILDVAADDVPDSDTVRRLIRDLREVRMAKARDGLEVLEDRYLQMDNIGMGEVNEIRGLFSGSMDILRKLQETKVDEEEDGAGAGASGTVEDEEMSDGSD